MTRVVTTPLRERAYRGPGRDHDPIMLSWVQVFRQDYDAARRAKPGLPLDDFLRAEIRERLTLYGAGGLDRATRREAMLVIRAALWGGHPPDTPDTHAD